MSAAVSPMQQREEIMDDEGCKSGSDDELDPGIVCVCVCVCWSTIIRVVARGARGAHYLSIVSTVLKLPTPATS